MRFFYFDGLAASGGTGDLSVTTDALTLVSASTLAISGTVAANLAALAVVSDGALAINGSTSSTLDPVTLLADGTIPVNGDTSATLDPVVLAATASSSSGINGDLAVTLDAMTVTSDAASVAEPQLGGGLRLRLDLRYKDDDEEADQAKGKAKGVEYLETRPDHATSNAGRDGIDAALAGLQAEAQEAARLAETARLAAQRVADAKARRIDELILQAANDDELIAILVAGDMI